MEEGGQNGPKKGRAGRRGFATQAMLFSLSWRGVKPLTTLLGYAPVYFMLHVVFSMTKLFQIDGHYFELRPIFILDPWIVAKMRVGPNRWRFLQQSLVDLDSNLRKHGSR
jgi:hypothetical protein